MGTDKGGAVAGVDRGTHTLGSGMVTAGIGKHVGNASDMAGSVHVGNGRHVGGGKLVGGGTHVGGGMQAGGVGTFFLPLPFTTEGAGTLTPALPLLVVLTCSCFISSLC
jgi:hypothetical protein